MNKELLPEVIWAYRNKYCHENFGRLWSDEEHINPCVKYIRADLCHTTSTEWHYKIITNDGLKNAIDHTNAAITGKCLSSFHRDNLYEHLNYLLKEQRDRATIKYIPSPPINAKTGGQG